MRGGRNIWEYGRKGKFFLQVYMADYNGRRE